VVLFAQDGPPVMTWKDIVAVVVAALISGGGAAWVGKLFLDWLGHRRLDRDARIADIKERLAEKDRQITLREESCRLCRQQADDQVKTVIRLHQIYGGCRAAAEAVHGAMQLSNERLRHANARLVAAGQPPEDVPDEPRLWFPDRAEAEFLTRTAVQGQKVVEAVREEVLHALPQVPEPPGADRRE
jgi:hypothetical protein